MVVRRWNPGADGALTAALQPWTYAVRAGGLGPNASIDMARFFVQH